MILWLMDYNAYIPLLIRQMNDAEENLNPTIFDVPPSFSAICSMREIGNCRNVRGVRKSMVVFRLFEKLYIQMKDQLKLGVLRNQE